MSRQSRTYRVAVVGLGVAGTAAAAILAGVGHQVTVFERSSRLEPRGGGIVLQPSGQAVLRGMGVLDNVVGQADVITRMTAIKADGFPLVGLDYGEVALGCVAYGLTQEVLFRALLERALRSGVDIRSGERIGGVDHVGEMVYLRTLDGSHGPFDLVVGADGAGSPLRLLCGLPARVEVSGHGSLWVTSQAGPTDGVQRHVVQRNRLLGMVPVGGGRRTLFWGIHRDCLEAWKRDGLPRWKAEVRSLCPEVGSVLDTVGSLEEIRFAPHVRVVIRRWWDRRIVFLGDAAHAVSPHLGQGVNLALRDAEQLARSLASRGDPQLAFEDFSRKRRRQTRFYAQILGVLSELLESPSPPVAWTRDRVFPRLFRHPWVRRHMVMGVAGLKPGWTAHT